MGVDEYPREYEEDIDLLIKQTLGTKELRTINRMSHATSMRNVRKQQKRK